MTSPDAFPHHAAATIGRRAALLLPFIVSACGGGSRDDYAGVQILPLRYDYLTKLRLNVASIDIDATYLTQYEPQSLSAFDPIPAADALRTMARDRLVAAGTSGRATFKIEDATILAVGDRLQASLAVQLSVATTDGAQSGYAEARVLHASSFHGTTGDLRPALYLLAKATMDDMNVEFEYQLRKSLGDYLLSSDAPFTAPPPPPVQSQDLAPPPAVAPPSALPAR